MTNNLSSNIETKINKVGIAVMSAMITAVPAFAAQELQGAIGGIIDKIGTLLSAVFNPICVLALGVCIGILVLGRNSKSAESSMSWAKRIVICFVIFNCLGSIASWLYGLSTGNNITSWSTAGQSMINMISYMV